MEKRFRVLVAFYGFVVLIMMANNKSDKKDEQNKKIAVSITQ